MENISSEYNPLKHCCEWWYKDFCPCVVEGMKKYKKDKRDEDVSSSINFLDKNKINYKLTKVNNVVMIKYNKTNYYVSLKGFKFKKEGTNVWIKKKKKLLGLNSVVNFGIHKGKKIKDIKINDIDYFKWMVLNTDLLFSNKALF